MSENRSSTVLRGAFLLTLAGLISKALSAGYRIPLQNLTGDLGFYIYQQVYPLLGIGIVLSLYGFPSAISKITVNIREAGYSPTLRSFYFPLYSIMFLVCGGLFSLLFFNANLLAEVIGDPQLNSAYQIAAFIFLFIPLLSLLRGTFQGNLQMKPTAYSQMSEQLIRVFIIIFVAILFAQKKVSMYQIGEMGALASIVGMIAASLVLVVFFIKEQRTKSREFTIPWKNYVETIFILGIVASLNHMVLLIIQFADVFTLVPRLVDYGLSSVDAMKQKGIFDRGQPLIQLGTVIGSSFALALIPSVSKQRLIDAPDKFYMYIRGALSFSTHLSIGATVGLIVIFPQVNLLLFQNTKGTSSLQILVIAILLSSIAITVCAILQGLGYMKRTALFIFIAFVIKWIANLMLVPLFGITGGALATIFSLFILCTFALVELHRQLPELKFFRRLKWGTIIKACLGMIAYLLLINYLISATFASSRILLLAYVIFVALTGAIVYIIILIRGRAFTKEQLNMLPYASLFIRLYKGGFR